MSRNERRQRGELSRVLVVDDEADIRELLDLTLSRMGLACDCAATLGEAQALLERQRYQLCLTDMRLPDGEGLSLVRLVGEKYAELPIAVITAYGSTENAVAALKAGAFDYLAKPVALNDLRTLIMSALDLPDQIPVVGRPSGGMVGESGAMQQVRELIEKLARSQAPVYISGESGCGKELAAQQIHRLGNRADKHFVPVNCGAIPENLVESEFFGYRKGAFTGADGDHDGFFQAADGGTLFLDEVADLPLPMQVKLLRALQEKRVRKVGCATEEPVDVRLICATHKNLKACVDAGTFRQDLYYRLNVIELKIPPLRERSEDVPALITSILQRVGNCESPVSITPEAVRALTNYPFPGNVRELENIIERATALCADQLIRCDDLQLAPDDGDVCEMQATDDGLQSYLDHAERQAIVSALEKTRYNRTAAARLLGVTFRSLRYRMERLGIV